MAASQAVGIVHRRELERRRRPRRERASELAAEYAERAPRGRRAPRRRVRRRGDRAARDPRAPRLGAARAGAPMTLRDPMARIAAELVSGAPPAPAGAATSRSATASPPAPAASAARPGRSCSRRPARREPGARAPQPRGRGRDQRRGARAAPRGDRARAGPGHGRLRRQRRAALDPARPGRYARRPERDPGRPARRAPRASASSPRPRPSAGTSSALGPRTRARVDAGSPTSTARPAASPPPTASRASTSPATPASRIPENFAADGLHPSPLGHARAADGFAELLGRSYGIEIPRKEPEDGRDHTAKSASERIVRRAGRSPRPTWSRSRPDRRLAPAAHATPSGRPQGASASASPTGCWSSPTPSAWCRSTPSASSPCAASTRSRSSGRCGSATRSGRARGSRPRARSTASTRSSRSRWRIVNQEDQVVARARVEVLWRTGEASGAGAVGQRGLGVRGLRRAGCCCDPRAASGSSSPA